MFNPNPGHQHKRVTLTTTPTIARQSSHTPTCKQQQSSSGVMCELLLSWLWTPWLLLCRVLVGNLIRFEMIKGRPGAILIFEHKTTTRMTLANQRLFNEIEQTNIEVDTASLSKRLLQQQILMTSQYCCKFVDEPDAAHLPSSLITIRSLMRQGPDQLNVVDQHCGPTYCRVCAKQYHT